jgi:hypothetical protein
MAKPAKKVVSETEEGGGPDQPEPVVGAASRSEVQLQAVPLLPGVEHHQEESFHA